MLQIDFIHNRHLPLLSREAQKRLDQAWSDYTGLGLDILMEQAGIAVAAATRDHADKHKLKYSSCTVFIFGGSGNNGADAWVSARHLLTDGFNVICCDLSSGTSPQLEAVRRMQVSFVNTDELKNQTPPDIIIDGILGTGFKLDRGVASELSSVFNLIQDWQQRRSFVISIDIPSGIETDSGAMAEDHICADYTVTFVSPKIGLAAAPGCVCSGLITTVPLSMPADWVNKTLENMPLPRLIDLEMVRALRPLRPADGHKGTFGRALLIGGNEGMAGSIALAGQAAARAGAGLITLAVGRSAFLPVLSAFPEGLTHDIGECEDPLTSLKTFAANKQAVAAGPGLGRPEWLPDYIEYLLREISCLVLDADALNEISSDLDKYQMLLKSRSAAGLAPVVLTPHPGEFRRLAPDLTSLLEHDRQRAALAVAERFGAIVVLKGAATVIALPDGRIYINSSGNDGMAKGGSGDCLTGIITGLLAQGIEPESAAISAVYLHGLAGDLAAEKLGRTAILPQDLLLNIGKAWLKAGWLGDSRSEFSI